MQQEPDRPVDAPRAPEPPPSLGPVAHLRAWWRSRRQPSQEEYFAPLLQEALAGRLDLRITGGQVIVDDLSGWQERVMTGIREATAEHDPPPDTLYESSLDRMRADSGLGEAQEPDGPRASAPPDTRLEDASTQTKAEYWAKIWREGLATPRNTTWDRAASDARPDDLPLREVADPRGQVPEGVQLGLDRGAEFAEGFAGNLDHMREVYGDDEIPVRDGATEALAGLAYMAGGERAEEHVRSFADIVHFLADPKDVGVTGDVGGVNGRIARPACGVGGDDWYRGTADWGKVTCEGCREIGLGMGAPELVEVPEYEDAILVPIDRLRTPEEIEALAPCHGNAVYWCPETAQIECPDHGGFDVCCEHPEYHWSLDAIEKYLHLRMVQVDEHPAKYADGTWHCRRGCDPLGHRQGYATREDYLAAHRCWLSS